MSEHQRIPSDEQIKGAISDWQREVTDINEEIGSTFGDGPYYEDLIARRTWFQEKITRYTSVLNGEEYEQPGDDTA